MAGLLDGKAAIITGGGSGIGEATARLFAQQGCKVVVAGRQRDRLQRVADEIGGLAVTTDVGVEDEVKALFEANDRAHGRLDVLFNNAGNPGPIMNAEDMDMEAWDALYASNVRGIILCIKHAVPRLRAQGGGAIINTSSIMGMKATPTRSAYCSTKFAVIAITQSVAQEVGRDGIRVNAVAPGAIRGDLMERVIARRIEMEGLSRDEVVDKYYVQPSPLGKWVEPEECADAVLFLASDAASAITGETLRVSAGR
ncbi:MAG TPA: SDR family oxidoreductase [Rhodospirillales bacterium]|jgi:NAD(P)-dependent dehydrogenase (short-subunit alcohol dehydrogenase family)|nr:SDR family oxidoreductase [Rhodospirillales bacterium]